MTYHTTIPDFVTTGSHMASASGDEQIADALFPASSNSTIFVVYVFFFVFFSSHNRRNWEPLIFTSFGFITVILSLAV